jgi:hypothetical protein
MKLHASLFLDQLVFVTLLLWSGALGIGITTNNPSKIKPSDLPRFAFRNLGEKEGYWLKAVSENLLSEGSKVNVCKLPSIGQGAHEVAYKLTIQTERLVQSREF